MKKFLMICGISMFMSTLSFATTAAKINDLEITVKEANDALQLLTKGDITKTWQTLNPLERQQLIQMMAPGKLVAEASKKELSEKEKEAAIAGFWMQKKMVETAISEDELKAAYARIETAVKKSKSKQPLPAFKQLKNNLKMKIAQEKVVTSLMKKAKIKLK